MRNTKFRIKTVKCFFVVCLLVGAWNLIFPPVKQVSSVKCQVSFVIRHLSSVISHLSLVSEAYASVPAQINYQGRYREDSVPTTGTRYFRFKLTSNAGSGGTTYFDSDAGDSTMTDVYINKGLFRVALTPTVSDDWGSRTPYLHVWVNTVDSWSGAVELTNSSSQGEQISSSLYSYWSNVANTAFNSTGTFTVYHPSSGLDKVGIGTTSPGQKLSVAGTLGIRETGSSPIYYSIFQGGDQSADVTYTLPTALPGSNKFLQSTLGGVLSWESAGGVTSLQGAYDGGRTITTAGTSPNTPVDITGGISGDPAVKVTAQGTGASTYGIQVSGGWASVYATGGLRGFYGTGSTYGVLWCK